MKLHFHPISSYSQKVLTALYEKNISFQPVIHNIFDPTERAAYERMYPLGRIPILELDNGEIITESTTIVDYLDNKFPGAHLIPENADLARLARHYDRVFDLYINNQFVTLFFDSRKPAEKREPERVANAADTLDKAYAQLDRELAGRTWATGQQFTIGDCSACPALAYAHMVRPFDKHKNLSAYYQRLMERPSFARAFKEAAPYLAAMMQG